MRKLIESTFVSLDGVVEAPEKWTIPWWGGDLKDYARARLAEVDAFLLGRRTYEQFAASWPQIKGDEYFDRINALPKFVASNSLRETTWNATLLKGDVAAEIARLKSQPGRSILKYGTSELDRTLIEHRLVDEFHFAIFPVAVGSGARLFEGIDTSRLKLTLRDTKIFASGVVSLTYVPTHL
jgi:dihydrofolate reductase